MKKVYNLIGKRRQMDRKNGQCSVCECELPSHHIKSVRPHLEQTAS